MPFSTVFIVTCSEAFSTLGDFISPFGLAGRTPAGKNQLLCFGQHLGGEWKATSEQKRKEKRKSSLGNLLTWGLRAEKTSLGCLFSLTQIYLWTEQNMRTREGFTQEPNWLWNDLWFLGVLFWFNIFTLIWGCNDFYLVLLAQSNEIHLAGKNSGVKEPTSVSNQRFTRSISLFLSMSYHWRFPEAKQNLDQTHRHNLAKVLSQHC